MQRRDMMLWYYFNSGQKLLAQYRSLEKYLFTLSCSCRELGERVTSGRVIEELLEDDKTSTQEK